MGDKTFSVPRLSIGAAQRIMDEVGARGKSLDKVYKALILADEEIHSNIRLLPASRTVVSKEYLEGLEALVSWLLGEAGDLPSRPDTPYHWRHELRARAERLKLLRNA
jgi:hypothetical protein